MLELGDIFGSQVGRIQIDGGRVGTGLDHLCQGFLLKVGIALHGGNQIGDEIGSALVGALDLAPLAFDAFIQGDKTVVGAHAPHYKTQDNGGEGQNGDR